MTPNPPSRPLTGPVAAVLICLMLVGAGAAWAKIGDPPKLTDEQRAKLDKGEVVTWADKLDGGGFHARAWGTIDSPLDVVWPIIDDCSGYKGTMPRILSSKELKREGPKEAAVIECEIEADMPFPFSDITSVSRAVHTVEPKLRRRKWELVRGGYEVNRGQWHLTPFGPGGKHTLAYYELQLKVDAPIPDSILVAAQGTTLKKLYENLREAAAKRAK